MNDETSVRVGSERAVLAGERGDLKLAQYPIWLSVAGITPDQKTIIGGFKTLSGMDSETEVIELGDGASEPALLEWYRRTTAGDLERRSGTVTVLDQDLTTVVARYGLEGAVPLALVAAASGDRAQGMAIEKIEIANEKVERFAPR
jgi:hypothetical protein